MNNLKLQASPPKPLQKEGEQEQQDPNLNIWGKPISPGKKSRSIHSMFRQETGFDRK